MLRLRLCLADVSAAAATRREAPTRPPRRINATMDATLNLDRFGRLASGRLASGRLASRRPVAATIAPGGGGGTQRARIAGGWRFGGLGIRRRRGNGVAAVSAAAGRRKGGWMEAACQVVG